MKSQCESFIVSVNLEKNIHMATFLTLLTLLTLSLCDKLTYRTETKYTKHNFERHCNCSGIYYCPNVFFSLTLESYQEVISNSAVKNMLSGLKQVKHDIPCVHTNSLIRPLLALAWKTWITWMQEKQFPILKKKETNNLQHMDEII